MLQEPVPEWALEAKADALRESGKTVMYLLSITALRIVAVSDTIKPAA